MIINKSEEFNFSSNVPENASVERVLKPKEITPAPRSVEVMKGIAMHIEEIDQLGQPIFDVLQELKESINKGDYGMVIGDDASGRVPAMIIQKVLKNIYQEKGFSPPEVRFVTGSKGAKDPEHKAKLLDEYLIKALPGTIETDRRVLVVTDMIDSGRSIEPLVTALSKSGVKFDVVTVATVEDQLLDELSKKWGVKVVRGQIGTPSIYKKPLISGYQKDPDELHATPLPMDEREKEYFKLTRKDARNVAGWLTKYYKRYLSS